MHQISLYIFIGSESLSDNNCFRRYREKYCCQFCAIAPNFMQLKIDKIVDKIRQTFENYANNIPNLSRNFLVCSVTKHIYRYWNNEV